MSAVVAGYNTGGGTIGQVTVSNLQVQGNNNIGGAVGENDSGITNVTVSSPA